MHHKLLCLMTVLMIVTLCLTACGGGGTPAPAVPPSSGPTPVSANAAQPTATPPAPEAMTPKELGDKIGAVYVRSLEAVTKLLERKPDAANVLPQVKDLKEQTLQQLIELGKQREALNASDRTSVDNAINLALGKIANEAWYKTYTELSGYYFDKDQDLQKVLASFNIIGQYANFDLLKQQEPKEAERLGIK
ncbi:hypothetical protein TFLX_06508 [Thermoflexales bacterium]|nr:hypothetical protein TFLX_06508 [Thermoflexales bacterium]